jgi:hypothetical protein
VFFVYLMVAFLIRITEVALSLQAFKLSAMSAEVQIPWSNPVVHLDRQSTVIPARPSQPQRFKLCPSDLQMLCCDYIQKGLIYQMSFADDHQFVSAVELLKKSLSEALVHFYPLAGRLITSSDGVLYIDCNDAGADLIEASASDVGIEEIKGPEIGPVVRQLFALDGAINLNGHFLPLPVVHVSSWSSEIRTSLCRVCGTQIFRYGLYLSFS